MTDRQTTIMILMPGRNALSIAVPRSKRASLTLAVLLPLLTGMFGQRYVGSTVAPRRVARAAMASIGQIGSSTLGHAASSVSTVSAALTARAEAVLPAPSWEPPLEAASPVGERDASKVIDVKSVLRGMLGLRRGSEDVARIPRTGILRLEALHLNEAVAVYPFDEQGQANPDAMAQLTHLMRCRITGTELPIDPQLIEILVRLHTLYGRAIQLVSGHRQPHTIGTKPTSQHALGRAADIRIPGVSAEELKRVALKLGARGVGLYPEKGFVHVDVRPNTRYTWVYTAGQGELSDARVVRPARLAPVPGAPGAPGGEPTAPDSQAELDTSAATDSETEGAAHEGESDLAAQ